MTTIGQANFTQNDYESMAARIAAQAETIRKLREALRPFVHPDLLRELGGNVEGGKSPVFQRGGAMLRLGDFRNAARALAETEQK